MKPQTGSFLASADLALADAHTILAAKVPRQAARLAYYAQFHAAQALIFERTGKIAKTHKGVNQQFHGVARTEPTCPSDLPAQLTKAYIYKENADYDGNTSAPVTAAVASDAIATAERFVAAVRQAIA